MRCSFSIFRIKKALKELEMIHSGLLSLVIAIMHSPHEGNCVRITLDGFEPSTPNQRTCRSYVYITGQIILDDGETLGNLPPHVIEQFKCPHYPNNDRFHLNGPKEGGWALFLVQAMKRCAPDGRIPTSPFQCSHSTGQTYRFTAKLYPFVYVKYCSVRFFLGEVLVSTSTSRRFFAVDHGLKGLSNEVPFMEFTEAPNYNTQEDTYCQALFMSISRPSTNGASDTRPSTDALFMFCGLAMAIAVL